MKDHITIEGHDVFSNALEPGWVQTKMGGPGAPDDMCQAHLTQVWLASGDDPKANVTGESLGVFNGIFTTVSYRFLG
jgi:hypothetical protein